MKRIVTFSVEADGKKRVQSISAPVDATKIDTLTENMGFIDAGYIDPAPVEGKKIELFYNSEMELVEVEYSNIEFDDLDPVSKISALKKENDSLKAANAQLKADNELTQEALMEVYELIVGGEE